jgi:hypothetical protein
MGSARPLARLDRAPGFRGWLHPLADSAHQTRRPIRLSSLARLSCSARRSGLSACPVRLAGPACPLVLFGSPVRLVRLSCSARPVRLARLSCSARRSRLSACPVRLGRSGLLACPVRLAGPACPFAPPGSLTPLARRLSSLPAKPLPRSTFVAAPPRHPRPPRPAPPVPSGPATSVRPIRPLRRQPGPQRAPSPPHRGPARTAPSPPPRPPGLRGRHRVAEPRSARSDQCPVCHPPE